MHTTVSRLLASASFLFAATGASAQDFNVSGGDLKAALDSYAAQSGVQLMYGDKLVEGARTKGVHGALSPDAALIRILKGTGFEMHRDSSGAIAIVRTEASNLQSNDISLQIAQASPAPRSSVETVTVTSSKLGGADVQSIPIAITALSQEQLTSTQTAGGPDLVKQVPNLTFTKTNFTGYNIQIRGIGTQAISVTTDPAVAVAFNDMPFIRNHFFEQEFFDVSQVEVLRGPQGTLYGRNATAGVVNVISAKPSDQYEALASVDVGNYNNRRLEGMLNIPIMGDKLGIRIAGEWTKRDGYSFNSTTDKPVDGRDLWSGRLTLGLRPTEWFRANLIWEHFSEDDDRMRTAKQLCRKDVGPDSVDGLDLSTTPKPALYKAFLSQGCLPTSLYGSDAFETPNGQSIPFVSFLEFLANGLNSTNDGFILRPVDPYASKTQSRNLRVIESDLTPTYRARNDTIEFYVDVDATPFLTVTSQTGYNKDELRSTEDFNRFNTTAGLFANVVGEPDGGGLFYRPAVAPDGIYCDPQLGCSSKMVGEDLSQERAWQFSQEMRLASHFSGPFNFSAGANYMHYQTSEDYYVFFNLLTAWIQMSNRSSPGDLQHCYDGPPGDPNTNKFLVPSAPWVLNIDTGNPTTIGDPRGVTFDSSWGCQYPTQFGPGTYIDPNPIDHIDGNGHNYFRSENPYRVNSFASFGEAYYQVTPGLKLIAGLRWTDDSKRFWNIPSWVAQEGGGYPIKSIVNQEWKEWTGRFVANWTTKLDFTDETIVYASYARGYKGGGANPPLPEPSGFSFNSAATHPPSFAPEFVNAFELGTKNSVLDGAMTLNAGGFYYDYKGYQISQIVDRTSINLNVDAQIKGAEVEATWEPFPGLRFNLSGGLQDSSINKGQSAIDLIDRTAGHSDWAVVKPFYVDTSNCILPKSIVRQLIQTDPSYFVLFDNMAIACGVAYGDGLFLGRLNFKDYFGIDYDPSTAPNNGAGFAKDLSGNKLPNTPPFTLSFGAQYSMPLSDSWAGTLRGDFYWQGNSFARIFNDKPYDQLHGYTNVNLALVFTNQDGWQAMLYAKNVFDTTAITGAFLNSDDTALTTNVFVTDPRLFGMRITKNW